MKKVVLVGKINKNIPVPFYYQLKEIIIHEINYKKLNTGDMLPSEMEISDFFDLSRNTVRQAITELVMEGFLYRVQGKGTFVSKLKINQEFLSRVESFNKQMERLGLKPLTKVLKIIVENPDEKIASVLETSPEKKVIMIERLRYANNEPIVVVKTFLPYDKLSFLLDINLEESSLYQSINIYKDKKIYRCRRIVEAVSAKDYESKLLEISKGNPIQKTTTVGFNKREEPIEYSIAYYRGDKNKFVVDVQVVD